jgi:hypothetical protein
VVNAPGRADIVAELFEQLGAEQTMFASRRAATMPAMGRSDVLAPEIRIGGETEVTPGA